jgi:S1-C subfamily serine protease
LSHVNRIPRVGVLDWDIVQETWMVIATPPIASNLEPMKKGEILPGTGAWNTGLDRASRLPADQWMQGKTVTSIVEPNAQKLKTSVIAILNEGIPVGLGTVVDNEGLAVVVASTLPPKPQCRLPDGSVGDVTVVGIARAFDIAVVRIPTRSIQAIMLEDIDLLPTGTLVAPIASDGQARAVGVVCVAPRKLAVVASI